MNTQAYSWGHRKIEDQLLRAQDTDTWYRYDEREPQKQYLCFSNSSLFVCFWHALGLEEAFQISYNIN